MRGEPPGAIPAARVLDGTAQSDVYVAHVRTAANLPPIASGLWDFERPDLFMDTTLDDNI